MYGVIYLVTCLANGKHYIGQTKQTVKNRWTKHCSYRGKTALSAAIYKYGSENFTIEMVTECPTKEELDAMETHYIKHFNSLAPYGYNLMSAPGKFGEHSEETKRKMREDRKGWSLGRKDSEETKKKKSEARKGFKPSAESIAKTTASNTGKSLTEERKKNISKSLKNRILSQEHRDNISKGMMGRPTSEQTRAKIAANNAVTHQTPEYKSKMANIQAATGISKAVICVETGIQYISINEAAKDTKIGRKYIRAILNGNRESHKGYTFKRVSNVS